MSVFWSAAVDLFIRAMPAHLMAYGPFRDRLRFPLWKVLLPVVLLQIVQSFFYGYVVWQGRDGQPIAYGFALVYMGLYFFTVRDDRFKTLFLYLLVTDYVMILRGITTFLEVHLFYSADMNFDSWTSAGLNLAVLLVSAPFMFHFFTNAREKVFSMDAPVFWRTAWLVPAFTTVVVMIFTSRFEADQVRQMGFILVRLLLLLCVFVVYSILLDSLDAIRRQAELVEQAAVQEQMLNLQKMQHQRLLKHMEEAKAARHDLRQHLEVIWAYLEKDDISGLKVYLEAYEKKMPIDTFRTFAKNFSINAVCTYYSEEARKYGIDWDIKMDIPERIPMNEPEICALLGNLLENAVDACREVQDSTPFIRVRGVCERGRIVFTVDNSCAQELLWENGRLVSTKHEGYGVGTRAVQETAERSGGGAWFSCKNGVFYASVLLYG